MKQVSSSSQSSSAANTNVNANGNANANANGNANQAQPPPMEVFGGDLNLQSAVMTIALLAWFAEYLARANCTC
jgi:hypothetical protein